MSSHPKIADLTPAEFLKAMREVERENFNENWEDKLTPLPVAKYFTAALQSDAVSVMCPVDFLPEALSVAPECAPYFWLDQMTVGPETQFAATQHPMACSLLTTREPMRFSKACCGQSVILSLTYRPPTKTVRNEEWIPPKGKRKGVMHVTTREVPQDMLFSACVWGRFQRRLFNSSLYT